MCSQWHCEIPAPLDEIKADILVRIGSGTKLRRLGLIARNDRDVLLAVVSYLPPRPMYGKARMCTVRPSPSELHYASELRRDDVVVMAAAVEADPRTLQYASPRLRDSEELVRSAALRLPRVVWWASERLRTSDGVLIWRALEASEAHIRSKGYQDLQSHSMTLWRGGRYYRHEWWRPWAPPEWSEHSGAAGCFWREPAFVRAACAAYGEILRDPRVVSNAHFDARDDPEAVLAAARAWSSTPNEALREASSRLRDDSALVTALLTLERDPCSLADASSRLRDDEAVVLEGVRRCGLQLEHASARLRASRPVALAAVRQCGAALEHCARSFGDDESFVLTSEGLPFASARLKDDEATVERIIKRAGRDAVLQHVSERLRREYVRRREAMSNGQYAALRMRS